METEQPALPDMEMVNFIEGMSQEERVEFKRDLLQRITDCTGLIEMVDEVQAVEGLAPVSILY